MDVDDRGQAHTVEAFSAAVVLLASVLFALQVTAVTPLTASTASQHIENQQSGEGGGVLDAAAENGTLKQTVLYWNTSAGKFYNASDENGVYTNAGPRTQLGRELNETFLDRGIAFDLTLTYVSGQGVGTTEVVDLGTPTDNAVTVTRSITIFDDDHLYHANGSVDESTNVTESASLYMNDEGEGGSHVFNVVRVELTLWRM